MMFIEVREPWQQPIGSETRHRSDREGAVPNAWPNRLDPFGDFADGSLHSFHESTPIFGQEHASAAAPNQRRSEMLFQMLDALAHCAMGDVHLLRGVREIQVSGSRFEEAKRLERGKCARHRAMIAALTAGVSNDRWQSSHQRRIMPVVAAPSNA